jgi:S1-C subfamily serine protease
MMASPAHAHTVAPPPAPPPAGIAARIAEGFFIDPMPPAVRAIWPSVYAFVCEGEGGAYTATAFLVRKEEEEKLSRYYFVTAGHSVDDCRQPRRYLAEDLGRPRFESDGITLAPAPRRLPRVAPVYVDDAYDVGIVKVEAARPLRLGAPLAVTGHCDKALHREVFAVGFPGVGKRPSLGMRREAKRWSKGEYVGLGRAEHRGTQSLYIASTVDSLPGSSGGPVVDANGELVGVVVKGAASPENGFRYDVDPHRQGDWHTFLVPCDALARIIARSGITR